MYERGKRRKVWKVYPTTLAPGWLLYEAEGSQAWWGAKCSSMTFSQLQHTQIELRTSSKGMPEVWFGLSNREMFTRDLSIGGTESHDEAQSTHGE